jgi:hypothetical protein
MALIYRFPRFRSVYHYQHFPSKGARRGVSTVGVLEEGYVYDDDDDDEMMR